MDAETWIDLILKRGPELRRAGVMSLGCDGNSVVLAPAEPVVTDDDDVAPEADDDERNPWENPASYPTGHVPSLGDIDDVHEMPAIPGFDS